MTRSFVGTSILGMSLQHQAVVIRDGKLVIPASASLSTLSKHHCHHQTRHIRHATWGKRGDPECETEGYAMR
jgi:hypothetical protein